LLQTVENHFVQVSHLSDPSSVPADLYEAIKSDSGRMDDFIYYYFPQALPHLAPKLKALQYMIQYQGLAAYSPVGEVKKALTLTRSMISALPGCGEPAQVPIANPAKPKPKPKPKPKKHIVGDCSTTKPSYDVVEYRVLGSGGAYSADVTYTASNGDTAQQTGVRLSWHYCFTNESLDFFEYVSAQNQEGYGAVTCELLEGGDVVKKTTSSGAYAICTASNS